MQKVAACLYVRDAEYDIQEWLAYHSIIGVQTFLIYDNGSVDATLDRIKAMSSVVKIHIVPWGFSVSARAQGEAYTDCLNRFEGQFDWILFLDVDEFLVSSDGQVIGQLLEGRVCEAAIAFNWACFGSNNLVGPSSSLTTEAFTGRADDRFGPNAHTKLILRPDLVLDYVNPHFFIMEGPIFRVSMAPVDWVSPGITRNIDLSGWKVNHYFVKSRFQWAAKVARGYRDIQRDTDLFDEYDRNEVLDTSAAAYANQIRFLIGSV